MTGDDTRIGSLYGSGSLAALLERARQEVSAEQQDFDPSLGDQELANRVRIWAAKGQMLKRLEGIVQEAAEAAKENG